MTEEKSNVININGTDFTPDQLDDKEKYFIAQIQDLQVKQQNGQFQLDQISVAKDFYTNALIESIEKEKQENVEEIVNE